MRYQGRQKGMIKLNSPNGTLQMALRHPPAPLKPLVDLALMVRKVTMRAVKPKNGYFLAPGLGRTVRPISSVYGFDRGKPIDRYYIEQFLDQNRDCVQGTCLEVTDKTYTRWYGGNKVNKSDVLDIMTNNPEATIYADIRKMDHVASNQYDCIILTQVLGLIDDLDAAIGECYRILKPGGTMLVTVSSLAPLCTEMKDYWRFTSFSARYLFEKHFNPEDLIVESYGNVLAGQCFWVGLCTEEMGTAELDFNDPYFPVITAVKATKRGTSRKDEVI